jgi:hypothetical protein
MRMITLLLLLLYSSAVFAVAPQFWEKNTQQQFAEGDPQSISINSEGELVLAPQLKKLYDGTDAIIWKIVKDAKGNLYLATGNDGRVLKLDALTGKVSTYIDTPELEVHAIISTPDGSLYAATSPDGKIYKVKPDGKSSVFFDPEDKYIWSLALDSSGYLYAGTGDEGKIYRIDPNGQGKLLIDTTENNITALLWTEDRNLLAGSDRNGILYQVDLSGKAFVLSDSELQQITSIYASPDGEVYFTAITGIVPAPGFRTPPELKNPQPPNPQPEPVPDTGNDEGDVSTTVEIVMPTQSYTPPPITRPTGASQLYRINPGGFVETVYTAAEDQILDIAEYGDELLLSTGKKAKLISIDPNKKNSILLKAPEEQMTSLLASEGKVWVATANPGNLYELVETHSSQGTYYSDIKDTQTISTWGQISWKGVVPPDNATLTLYTRSGNTKVPDETWSDWASAGTNPEGAHVTNPRSRFVQWKAEFTTKNPASTPVLRSVSLAYLQQNLRPEVLSITLHSPGVVYRKTPIYTQDSFAGISETAASSNSQDSQDNSNPQQSSFDFGGGLGKREIRKGYQTLTWSAVDQNQDDLRYDISYRSENDKTWKELVTNLKDKVFAWDTQTLPDGTYTIRVTANDSGSNPKEYVLNNSKDSSPFDIDNSAPTINVKEGVRQDDKIVLVVQAKDLFSSIRDMQYSITPGEWVVVFPVDSINDSLSEDYRIELSQIPAGVDTIILRCSDRVRNTTTTKYRLPK